LIKSTEIKTVEEDESVMMVIGGKVVAIDKNGIQTHAAKDSTIKTSSIDEVRNEIAQSKGKYFVVGGSYITEAAAKMECQKWSQLNYKSTFIKVKGSSLIKIVLKRFVSGRDASNFAISVKKLPTNTISVHLKDFKSDYYENKTPKEMKKKAITLSAMLFIASSSLTNCNTSNTKVEDAKKDVIEAEKDLDLANEVYQNEIENYRKETLTKISDNDKIIADYKLKIKDEKKDVKLANEKKIAELDQKNIELKQKMNNYKANGKENWEIFKKEFNHDMDELGKAFKDLTVKNVK
jgi:predicted small secreted protein